LLPEKERTTALLYDNALKSTQKIERLNSKDEKIIDNFVRHHKSIDWESDYKLFEKMLNYANKKPEKWIQKGGELLEDAEVKEIVKKLYFA